MSPALNDLYPWRFFRAGGLDQVALERSEDLINLEHLDPKLWVALSCPTWGLEFDSHTLQLLDSDSDGRIRPPEILSAIKWTAARLKSIGSIASSKSALPLADIDQSTPEGKRVYAATLRILRSLQKEGATEISSSDTTDTNKILSETLFNGDGVVPSAAARTPLATQTIEDVISVVGSLPDRSGKPGISKPKLDAFFDEVGTYVGWCRDGDALRVGRLADLATSLRAYVSFTAVQAKLDEHFIRLRMAAFEPRIAAALNRSDVEYAALAAKDLTTAGELTTFPLQRVAATDRVNLNETINPAWCGLVEDFRINALAPLLGNQQSTLTEPEWIDLKASFTAISAWSAAKKGGAAEKLGRARCEEILASDVRREIEALIQEDLELAPEFEGIGDADRLVHYNRDLFRLLNNFVNFKAFYDPRARGIFQVGTLYLDQRSCDLCVHVEDPGAHAGVAVLSRIYVAYCHCTRPSGEQMHVAAAFTQGDSDYLTVGRRGVFYDLQGRDWDAAIVKVIENPIGLRQAFWSPYKKALRLIEEQIEKFAAAKDKAVNESAASNVGDAAHNIEAGKGPEKKDSFDVAKFAGIFAAIGLAIGAIGGAMGAMVSAFASLAWWQMPLAIGGIVLAVSGPSMLIAALKLRQRTLGPLLEGNGWAINGRIGINIPLGTSLTAAKKLPAGAKLSLADPFEDKAAKRRRRVFVATVILVCLTLAGWFGHEAIKGRTTLPALTQPK